MGTAVGVLGRRPPTVGGGGVTLLAIESATNLVGVALLTDWGSGAERSHQGGRVHAEMLAPAIEEVCAISGLTVQDIDVVAVDVGPGLFTGLRVGVATAKALAQALGLGVLGVSSLDILAAAAVAEVGTEGGPTVVAVVDARRGEVFAARYRLADSPAARGATVDPALARQPSEVLVMPEALVASLTGLVASGEGPVVVVGDGAARYRDLLATVPRIDLGLVERVTAPPPLILAHVALGRIEAGAVPSSPVDLVPDYRRQADARINWERRVPPRPARDAPVDTVR